MYNRNQASVDFMKDQLDIKRKMKVRIGEKIVVRLKFERPSFSGHGAAKQHSYEMVSGSDGFV